MRTCTHSPAPAVAARLSIDGLFAATRGVPSFIFMHRVFIGVVRRMSKGERRS